jgi:hypothetical protein
MGVTSAGPPERGPGQVPTAAVPDGLHHRGQKAIDAPWSREPGRDPIAGVPAEADFLDRDRVEWSFDRLAGHLEVMSTRFGQGPLPEVVEVVWFRDRRLVVNEFIEW